jgi:CO/xanthine dehydrogenase Mo-binding subunit
VSRVEERLRFEADGSVTALSGKMEYGQGLRAAYPRIVAEELGVAASRVRVVLGETDVVPWDMGTFGSLSVEMDGREMRRAAAFARAVLLSRGAERLGRSVSELAIEDGAVVCVADGRAVTIAELASGAPITGEIPEDVRLVSPTPTCPDGPAEAVGLVTGKTPFVGDVRLPGMLHGHVLHPAIHGARLRTVDRDAAMAQPGVVAVVVEGDFVGVVAERHDQALRALHALHPTWERPPLAPSAPPSDVFMRSDPAGDESLNAAFKRVSARYFTPHVANAPIGPSVGLADVRDDEAEVYASTQAPFGLRDAVAAIAGLPPERVHFHPRAMSGGYGRHGSSDAAIEAARLSKAVGRPVLVQWGRPDELHGAPHRAEMNAAMEAGLDPSGTIVAWRSEVWTNPYGYDAGTRPAPAAAPAGRPGGWDPAQRTAMMAGRNAIPPYDLGAAEVRLHVTPGRIRTGALRSLGASPNIFAIESFVDELAHAAGVDPIEFRLRHTRDPRLRRVLETVRERSGWGHTQRPTGRGLGVACVVYRATYVAEVAEVSIEPGRDPRLERVWCAVDAGHIVHPDGARNQVEGAVQMGASWALIEELPERDGEVLASTWEDYPIATFRDAPRAVDIVFTGDDTTPSSGLGEPPAVPIAPAIANAVYGACGVRVRRLPIRAAAIQRAAGGGGSEGPPSTTTPS